MDLTPLQQLGLSTNEAKVYHCLLRFGGSGVSTVALRAKIHRRNAYDALHRLIEKGLVYEVFSQTETVYEAVDPTKLVEFVKEKERLLAGILPNLLSEYGNHQAPQRAHIYKGLEGVKNYLREALQVGEDIYCFGAKGGWFDPRLETFLEWFLKEGKKKGMGYFHIFDDEVQNALPHVIETIGHSYKFLPKEFSTNSTINIFGDHVVTFTGLTPAKHEDDVTIFVMVSPDLAESYRTWWKLVWELLPETGHDRKYKKEKSAVAKV